MLEAIKVCKHCSCIVPLDSHHNTLHQKWQGVWLPSLSPDPVTQLLDESNGLWPKPPDVAIAIGTYKYNTIGIYIYIILYIYIYMYVYSYEY